MAHSEACQLFIEERIKEGLAEGKSAYAVAKELSAKIQQMFETAIPHSTLKDRALRMKRKIGGNPPTRSTPANHSEIQEKRHNQVLTDDKGKFTKGTAPGPGRPPKYETPVEPYSCALQMATIAISQLSRIRRGDPKRKEAFQEVINWINDNW